jgi:peptidoglycan/LPS O-acetylase OafA/YrhL
MTDVEKQRLDGIQALRAIAAIAVVLFHTMSTFDDHRTSLPNWINGLIARGNIGVDLFFVISGFVITLSTFSSVDGWRTSNSPLSFWVKRFFRIAPAYWVVTIVYIYYYPIVETGKIEKSLLFAPLSNDQAPYYGVPVLYVGWSLVYEMYFYLVFGASLFFKKKSAFFLISYFAATLVVIPIISGNGIHVSPEAAGFYRHAYFAMATNPMVSEFLLGCGVAYLYRSVRDRVVSRYVVALLISSVILVLLCIETGPGGFSVVRHGVPFSALLLAVVLADYRHLIRVPRFAVYLGEISYGIYLVHPISLLYLARTRPQVSGLWHIEAAEYLMVLGMTIFLADLLHRYIENPCIHLGKRVAKLATKGVVGRPVIRTKGIGSRVE